MPIVISYNPANLIGDLAQNAGQFATGQQNFQDQLQQQASNRQGQQQALQNQLALQREQDLNQYRSGNLDTRQNIASGNQQTRQGISDDQIEAHAQQAAAALAAKGATVAEQLQAYTSAKTDALNYRYYNSDQNATTRNYATDQNVASRNYATDARSDTASDANDTRQKIADQKSSDMHDSQSLRAQQYELQRQNLGQRADAGDMGAARAFLGSIQKEIAENQQIIDGDEFNQHPEQTQAAQARIGVLQPQMERARGILQNRMLRSAAGAAPTTSPAAPMPDGSAPSIPAAPTTMPAVGDDGSGGGGGGSFDSSDSPGVPIPTVDHITRARQLKAAGYAPADAAAQMASEGY